MTTAAELITDALDDINVNASESSIDPSDMQKSIRIMNRMVASWNLALGYTDVVDPSDTLTVITGAELAIQQNLAINLASTFDAIATQELKNTAFQSYQNMLSQVVTIKPLGMPSTMPKGSGNYQTLSEDNFYLDSDPKGMIYLSANTTETIISTASTAVLVLGAWVQESVTSLTSTAAGRITYNPSISALKDIDLTASVLMSTSGKRTVKIHLVVNGLVISGASVIGSATSSAEARLSFSWPMDLFKGDYIEMYVSNETDTDNVIVSSATLRIS